MVYPGSNDVVDAKHVADKVVNRCQHSIVYDEHEEMRNSESQHSFSGRTEIGECLQTNVSQQAQMVIVTVFVPVVFAYIAWEELLIVAAHSVGN